MDIKDYLKRKFPHDEKINFYVAPNLPATKLGKILMKETRISQPGDVVALHVVPGFFSSDYIIFTDTSCYHPGGTFLYEDIKRSAYEGDEVLVIANRLGQPVDHRIKVKDEETARVIAKVLDDVMAYGRKDIGVIEEEVPDYAEYEGMALDWLKLRDEVMRTIDMLHERFQDGKLSLLEYEEKKTDLLLRL